MKRIIISLLVCLTCLCTFSQINTTIWGVTINKSKKQQVINKLQNKGFRKIEKLDFDDVLYVKDYSKSGKIRFGGISWESAHFNFYKGVLYRIEFHRPIYYYDGLTNDYIRKSIQDALAQKYSVYFLNEVNEYNKHEIWYYDNVLMLGFLEDDQDFSLIYCDNLYFMRKQYEDNNEY